MDGVVALATVSIAAPLSSPYLSLLHALVTIHTAMAPLTADELLRHPEYDHTIWPLVPDKKGQLDVAHTRGGPLEISFEVHGTGDIHLVWIMGLGAMKYACESGHMSFLAPASTNSHMGQRQLVDCADKDYSSLVFDNRGIGESGKPSFRYSTSEMARDVVELVDHLGWTNKRELHVIGISMGGMIAQELVSPIFH